MKNTQEAEELFDVVIFEIATRKIDTVIGKNLKRWDGTGSGRHTAELRQQTGQERVNDRYGVEIVEAGKYDVGSFLPNTGHEPRPGGSA